MGWFSRIQNWFGRRKVSPSVTVESRPDAQVIKESEPVKMDERVTVIVPAYNEEKNIASVIAPLLEWQKVEPKKRHFVVVDDGSKDQTVKIAKSMGAEVIYSDQKTKQNRGKAQALLAGARYAKQKGSEVLVTLDADLYSLRPEKVDKL